MPLDALQWTVQARLIEPHAGVLWLLILPGRSVIGTTTPHTKYIHHTHNQ